METQVKELPIFKDVDFRNNMQRVYISEEEKEKLLDKLNRDVEVRWFTYYIRLKRTFNYIALYVKLFIYSFYHLSNWEAEVILIPNKPFHFLFLWKHDKACHSVQDLKEHFHLQIAKYSFSYVSYQIISRLDYVYKYEIVPYMLYALLH